MTFSGAGDMYALEWECLFGLSVALVMFGAAVAIVAFAPRARANRRLSLFMIAEAVGLGAGWCMAQMALDASHYRMWAGMAWVAYAAQVPLYVLFLATLKTPLVKPFAISDGGRRPTPSGVGRRPRTSSRSAGAT